MSASEATVERAAALAGARGVRISHLVAPTRLADLLRSTPRGDQARAALRAVYDTSTAVLEVPQLLAARALLDGN